MSIFKFIYKKSQIFFHILILIKIDFNVKKKSFYSYSKPNVISFNIITFSKNFHITPKKKKSQKTF